MNRLSHFHLLVVVASALLFNTNGATATAKEEELLGNHVATVHVVNGLPEKSEAMKIECSFRDKTQNLHKSLGVQDLNMGDDYSWSVEEKVLHQCQAIWRRQMASWHAFQPPRDAKHPTVYWLVKENGFFLSWDNSTWVRRSTWETE